MERGITLQESLSIVDVSEASGINCNVCCKKRDEKGERERKEVYRETKRNILLQLMKMLLSIVVSLPPPRRTARYTL